MARTQGKTNLDTKKKARILAKKNLQISTQEKIAKQEGVCRDTVAKLKPDNQPPEVVNLADEYSHKIVDNLKKVAMLGIENTLEKLHELNAKDSMIVSATAIDKAQLLTNNPTSIVQNQSDSAIANRLLEKALENGAKREEAIDYICTLGFSRESFEK